MREKIKKGIIGLNPDFNYRGTNQTRVETLSDAVFAIAIALLVLSSSVPERFDELLESMHDLIPFAICITLLSLVWYQHYLFFIRYGLQDSKTVALNTVLLFLILFYVYPLKFLFKVLYQLFYGGFTNNSEILNKLFNETLPINDSPSLMIIYGIGATLIFFTLALMYFYASKKKEDLELSVRELYDTKSSIYNNLIMGAIPLLSVIISWLGIGGSSVTFTWAGFIYWLYMPIMPIYSISRARIRKKKFGAMTEE